MATLVVNKTYEDGQILGEANLDNAFDSIEDFVNSKQIGADNIQNNSIGPAELQTSAVTTDKIADGAVTTPKLADGAVTLAKLAAAVAGLLVPVGRISAYGGTTAPTGWLVADGSAVSRTTYSALFGVYGVRFGQGDGSTTFNLPDLRGRFLRGRDSGSARDPDAASRTAMNTGGATGDNIGSVQLDDWKWTEGRVPVISVSSPVAGTVSSGSSTPAGGNVTIGVTDGTKTGLETRPKNANVLFIVKV